MPDPVLAQLARLKTASTLDLRAQWRKLFDSEPPLYNRRFLESRLAYRIQELAFGGLKRETIARLEALGETLDGGKIARRTIRADRRPAVGVQLVREWNGIEHVVTVGLSDFTFQGRPYKSLSGVARAITGGKWNGWVFFGIKNQRGIP